MSSRKERQLQKGATCHPERSDNSRNERHVIQKGATTPERCDMSSRKERQLQKGATCHPERSDNSRKDLHCPWKGARVPERSESSRKERQLQKGATTPERGDRQIKERGEESLGRHVI